MKRIKSFAALVCGIVLIVFGAALLLWRTFGIQDTLWTMAVIVSGFTLGLLFIIELFVSIHYERKE
mgnify:CR=1 FL=1